MGKDTCNAFSKQKIRIQNILSLLKKKKKKEINKSRQKFEKWEHA